MKTKSNITCENENKPQILNVNNSHTKITNTQTILRKNPIHILLRIFSFLIWEYPWTKTTHPLQQYLFLNLCNNTYF